MGTHTHTQTQHLHFIKGLINHGYLVEETQPTNQLNKISRKARQKRGMQLRVRRFFEEMQKTGVFGWEICWPSGSKSTLLR